MISYESIKQYRKVFPNDSCAYDAVGYGEVIITNGNTGESFRSNSAETDEVFLDRIKRSVEQNQNLFYDEWSPMVYNEGCIY